MTQVILTAINSDTGKGTILDLYENETIAQTWKFTDISDLKGAGGFSRQFSIPNSPTNVSFFGALDDVNAQSWFKFGKKVDATLSIDTVPVAVGHLQVKKIVKTKDGSGFDYDVVFYTETTDLATVIGDKKLSDIAALADLDEIVNSTNVTDLDDANLRYFLCDRGQKWSQMGEAGTRPIWNPSRPMYAADLTPAINGLWLFNKIVSEAGYTWEGATLEAALTNYWIPFNNSQNIVYSEADQTAFFEAGFLSDQLSASMLSTAMTEVYDNGGNLSGGIYTAPYTATFRFEVWAGVTPNIVDVPPGETPMANFAAVIVDNSTSEVLAYQDVALFTGVNHVFFTMDVFLTQGQAIKLIQAYATNSSSFNLNFEGLPSNSQTLGTGWRISATTDALSGGTIDLSRNAPDVTQAAFMKDIARMHNLAIIADRNIPNKVKFIPLAEYLENGEVKDWTGKLDESQDIVISPTDDEQKRTLIFTYKAGGDANSKYYADKKQRVYGDYKVDGYTATTLEEPSDFATGELKIDLTASSTPCSLINGTPVPIPKFIADNGNYVAPGLRFLFAAGTVEVYLFIDGVGAEIRSVGVLNHYDSFNPTVDGNDLNFAPEAPMHSIVGNPYNNLFNLYWRRYLNEIYSQDARVMEAMFALNTQDILTFKFNDKIYIKDAYWRILEINNHGLGKETSTSVKLMKYIDVNIDCAYQPVSVNTDGEVVFENSEGDESAGNELCCTRYGYFWVDDGTRQYCSAFPPSTGSGGQTPQDLFALGTRSIGVSQGDRGSTNQQAFKIGNAINAKPETVNSLLVGQNIKIGTGNGNTYALGDSIELSDGTGGGMVIGDGVSTGIKGFHLGGGWYDGNRNSGMGTQQTGIFVMSGEGDFDGVSEIPIYLNGIVGKHINLPDETSWAVTLQLIINQYSAGSIIGTQYGSYVGTLNKVSGAAFKGEFSDVFQDGTLHNMSIEVDTSTDTDEHRLSVKHHDGTTHNGCRIVATLTYTQLK